MDTATHTNPILKAAEDTARKAAVQTRELAQETRGSLAETDKAAKDLKSATERKAAAEKIIATQQGIADLQTQENTIKFFENAGGTDIFNRLGEAYKGAAEDIIAAEAEVERITEDDHGGGILGYFKQQFALSSAETNLVNSQKRAGAIEKVTTSIASQTESVARASNFAKKAKTLSTMQAEQAKLSALALEETAKTAIEVSRINADAIGRIMSATSQELTIAMKNYELQNAEESRAMQRASHAVNMELALHQLNRLDLDERTVQMYIPLVQAAQAKAGLPVEDPLIVRNGIEEIKKNTPTGLRYQRYVEMGLRQGNYGYTPSEAAETISVIAPTGLEMTPPLQVLESVRVKIGEKTKSPSYVPPKNKAEADALFNSTAKDLSDSWKSVIKFGDASNPYLAPPFAVLGEMESVKASALHKIVLAPLGLKEFSAKQLFQEAARGVATKLITPEEATLGIETVMKAAVSYNNEHWQFAKVGFPVQDSYITYASPSDTYSPGLSIPTIFGDYKQESTNILDPVEIKSLLIKYLSRQMKSTYSPGVK